MTTTKRDGECEHEQDPEGWGWWTVHNRINDWLRATGSHVPWPDEHIVPGYTELSELTPGELATLLQRYGGYLTFLRAERGLIEGRAYGLSESYDSAMSVMKGMAARILKGTPTEAAKESWALNHEEFSEPLRIAKRNQIEHQAIIFTIKGMIDAYQGAWETVSRLITATGIEADLSTSRHA